jgi:UDP-N-acetylmuramoyl-tripeptide--D-alanyl-D-alanine ligase
MTVKEILELLAGEGINLKNPERIIRKFSIDTRTLQEGDFFIPLKGANFDGHEFIKDAIKKGASGYLTEKGQCKYLNGIKVNNTLEALRKIGQYKRKKIKNVIGITGTAGKTTTKELAKKVLSQIFNVYGTEGNYNNHIGLPLSLANTPEETEVGIFELGANKIGDIAELVKIAQPDIRVLTSLGIAHTEGFGSFKGVIQGKGEIFEGGDKNVLPYNVLPYYKLDNYITFGRDKNADIKIQNVEITEDGTVGEISFKNDKIKLKIPIYNKAIFDNIGAVAGILYYLGLNPITNLKVLEDFQPVKGRGNTIKRRNITVIDESYNANPLSVQNAIYTLAEIPAYKILVLGDMLELGDISEREHKNIGKLVGNTNINEVYLYGNETKATYEALKDKKEAYHFTDKGQLIEKLKEKVSKINQPVVILIKGSNSMGLKEVVEQLTS